MIHSTQRYDPNLSRGYFHGKPPFLIMADVHPQRCSQQLRVRLRLPCIPPFHLSTLPELSLTGDIIPGLLTCFKGVCHHPI